MARFRDDKRRALTESERLWVSYLIEGFRARYDQWLTVEADYLDTLYKKRSALVQFAGHAYLHIGFDLPLVLADSLDKTDRTGQLLISRARASQIFGELEGALDAALRADWDRPFSVDIALKTGLDDNLLSWVVGLRNSSWKHGVDLADSAPEERSRMIERLHDDLHAHLKKASAHSIPLLLVTALRPPRTSRPVFVFVEVGLWLVLAPLLGVKTAAGIVVAIFAVRVAWEVIERYADFVVRTFLRRLEPPLHP